MSKEANYEMVLNHAIDNPITASKLEEVGISWPFRVVLGSSITDIPRKAVQSSDSRDFTVFRDKVE